MKVAFLYASNEQLELEINKKYSSTKKEGKEG